MKTCANCKEEKPLGEFSRDAKNRDGLQSWCKKCDALSSTKWRQENPEKNRAHSRKWKKDNLEKQRAHSRKWCQDNPIRNRHSIIRSQAKIRGIPFDLSLKEYEALIHGANLCPILGMPMVFGNKGQPEDNSMSIDRINNDLGYTKGNVWVISNRANSIKRDATLEELEQLVAALERRMNVNIPENGAEFTGTIHYSKTIRPREYESETVGVSLAVSDGDDQETTLDMLREMAYRHLGRSNEYKSYGLEHAPQEPKDLAHLEGEVVTPVVEDKPKRTRRTKAQSAPKALKSTSSTLAEDKAAEEAAQLAGLEEKSADPVVEEEETSGDVVSMEELTKWATAAAAKGESKNVMQLAKDRFGVERLGLIKESDRAEMVKLIKVLTSDGK